MTRTDLLFRLSLEKLMTMISMMKRRSKRGIISDWRVLEKGLEAINILTRKVLFYLTKEHRRDAWDPIEAFRILFFSMRLYLLRHWRVLDRIWWLRLISPSVAESRCGCASRTASSHTHFLDVECSVVMFFVKRKWNGNWLFFFFSLWWKMCFVCVFVMTIFRFTFLQNLGNNVIVIAIIIIIIILAYVEFPLAWVRLCIRGITQPRNYSHRY